LLYIEGREIDMAGKKSSSKVAKRRAGKILSNPRSSKSAKSAAAKVVFKPSSAKRSVKAAPKTGAVSRAATKRAISRVTSSKARKK